MHQTLPVEGRVLALAVRSQRNGPMQALSEAVALENGGLQGDLKVEPDRGVTLLAMERWADACQVLGETLPWHTRRANVLVEGLDLGSLIASEIKIGDVRIRVIDQTHPCGLMDRQWRGLRRALEPDFRGGVYGRILNGGTLRVGDPVRVVG